MAKTRKAAAAICQAQIRAGRKVLKAKTRKQALALLKKVPHMVSGNIEGGMAWWDRGTASAMCMRSTSGNRGRRV